MPRTSRWRRDLVAPDGVGEVRHGVSPVVDVCRERGVGRATLTAAASSRLLSMGHFCFHAQIADYGWRRSAGAAARGVRQVLGGMMRVSGIVANLPVADIAAARDFYTDYLGLSVEGFNLGWVANYRSPSGEATVQLVTRDATAPHDSVISVHVGSGVDEAYAEAQRRGYEIVHPLTDEAWGVRRFFVRAPDGNVINIVSHSDE